MDSYGVANWSLKKSTVKSLCIPGMSSHFVYQEWIERQDGQDAIATNIRNL